MSLIGGILASADTIYALATGAGVAAIAVVRLSGPEALGVAGAMVGRELRARMAVRARLKSRDGLVLDDALVIGFPGPRSFTGEDVCELHLHGGRAVVEAVLQDLSARGLRAAEAGEFTRRAFLNGKIDLVEVEGLGDLLAARTQGQRRQALRQLEGEASRVFESWRRRLVRVLAYIEAMIDFSDEADVAGEAVLPLVTEVAALRGEIAMALSRGRQGERMRDGARVVLAGAPNAGKSSLFNALVKRDAAMVSDIPGTTRDVIEALLDIVGLPVVLADTAGLRAETGDVLEAEGMRRSLARVSDADVVLWVGAVDANPSPKGLDSEPIYIWNKADLAPAPADGRDWIPVSARSGAGLAVLECALAERLKAGASEEDVLITRDRHRQALERTGEWLDAAVAADAVRPELLAEALRQAAACLGRLTGRVDVEDLLDVIFRDFCIGK